MRIIKLSTEEFETFEDVVHFFEEDLPQRKPPGKFLLPPGWIAEDGLQCGETLLFTHLATVCYSARAGSVRLENTDEYGDDYPYYFKVVSVCPEKSDFADRRGEMRAEGDAKTTWVSARR